uniref:Type III secretion protein n=1 Tax=Macrostomum lignano TaxID=282301 RepID=A0A1I8F2E0_9PLAT
MRSELELPALPDMVFDRNCLRLEHESNPACSLEFNALDALRRRLFIPAPCLLAPAEGASGCGDAINLSAAACWDTRLSTGRSGWTHLLRGDVKRFESGWDRLAKLPAAVLTDASALQEHLTLIDSRLDRLVFGPPQIDLF